MSNEELVQMIQRGNTALVGELWERVYNFVHVKAQDMHAGDLTEDLEQECYFALLDAIDHYDAALGYKFLTYAGSWFFSRMQRYISTQTGTGVLPVNLLLHVRKYKRLQEDFRRDHGRVPTGAEVLAATGWSLDDLVQVLSNLNADTAASLDAPLSDGDGELTLADTVAGGEDPADLVEDKAFHDQMRRDVWAAVETLPTQQAEALTRHYRDGSTYQDIEAAMNLRDGQTRQLCAKGLRTLRTDKATVRRLRPYYLDLYGISTHGSLTSFLNTRTSSTERAALLDMGEYLEGNKYG